MDEKELIKTIHAIDRLSGLIDCLKGTELRGVARYTNNSDFGIHFTLSVFEPDTGFSVFYKEFNYEDLENIIKECGNAVIERNNKEISINQ